MDELRGWIREHLGLLGLGAAGLLLGLWGWQGRPLHQPPGILAPDDPLQAEPESREPWTVQGQRVTPLARFELRARVLSRERYRFDRASTLSPIDLALGWGPMSDSANLDAIHIEQRDRWYFWRAARLPIPHGEVVSHSANMHMIPADRRIERQLLAARAGQLVELGGYLVRVDGTDGWRWVSSLTRTDTGDGSCEVVWVDAVRIADR